MGCASDCLYINGDPNVVELPNVGGASSKAGK